MDVALPITAFPVLLIALSPTGSVPLGLDPRAAATYTPGSEKPRGKPC